MGGEGRARWVPSAALFAGALLAAWFQPGCKACERAKPLNPYATAGHGGASAAAVAGGAAGSAGAGGAAPFEPRAALTAPPDQALWELDGERLQAPEGQVFVTALPGVEGAPGERGVVAWTAPQGAADAGGELWWFPSARGEPPSPAGVPGRPPAPPRLLAEAPGFVPSGDGCVRMVTLAQLAPAAVSLDLAAACTVRLLPGAPVRALLVVEPRRDEAVVAGFRVTAAVPGEVFSLRADVSDVDRDGLGDLTLHARLERGGQSAEARLAWYFRAAGLARDPAQPEETLRAAARSELAQALQKDLAAGLEKGAALERLWAALCAESGTPYVLDAEGAPLSCEGGGAMDEVTTVETRALLAHGDGVGALAALERDGWFGVPLAPDKRAKLAKEISAALGARAVQRVLRPAARPVGSSGQPRWSPLRYESAAKLLVLTAEGVQRVGLPGGEVTDASEAVDPWPLPVVDETGAVARGLLFPCATAGVALQLGALAGGTQQAPVEAALPLLSPRPGQCVGGGAEPLAVFEPLGWARAAGSVLEGWVAGSRVKVALPRPDAAHEPPRASATATSLGLLLQGDGGRAELWHFPVAVRRDALPADCVAAPDLTSAACVEASELVVTFPSEKPASAPTGEGGGRKDKKPRKP